MGKLAAAAGILVEVVEPVVVAGEIVSSSRVRRLVADGQVGEARRLLTEPYRVRGMVVHGAGRGAKIGFATANVDAIDTILPASGVYAGRALIDDRLWPAAINVGANPTFGEQAAKVEAHLIGWHDPLYGYAIELDFLERLRGVQRFAGVAELRGQLACDVAEAGASWRCSPNSPGIPPAATGDLPRSRYSLRAVTIGPCCAAAAAVLAASPAFASGW